MRVSKDPNNMPEQEIIIKEEVEPRFTLGAVVNDSKIFNFNFLPHVGLISPEQVLIIPELCFKMFNPSSLEAFKQVEVGDMIAISADPDHEIYQKWNPPAALALPKGYTKMLRVRHVNYDGMGYRLVVADESI